MDDLAVRAWMIGRDRDIDVSGRIHRRIDELVGRAGLVRPADRDGVGERLPAVTRYRDPDLRCAAVVDRPSGVDVVLIAIPGDVVDRHPLLVLDEPEAKAGPVGGVLKGSAAVTGDPVPAEVVAVRDGDVRVAKTQQTDRAQRNDSGR